MKLLLSGFFSENIIVPIILGVAVLVAILIALGLKQAEKRTSKTNSKLMPKKISLTLNNQYMTKYEYAFLTVLHKALPPEFIAFPKVSLGVLLNPGSDKISYNMVEKYNVDICVFLKDSMEPVLVIDLLQSEASAATFQEITPMVREALNAVKLKIVDIKVQNDYSIPQLKKTIISNLPDKLIVRLRDEILK